MDQAEFAPIRRASAKGFCRFTNPIGLPMYLASEALEASGKSMTELWFPRSHGHSTCASALWPVLA
jgi:hypothetical protein